MLFTVICSKYCSNVCSSTSFPFLPSRWSLRFQIYFILFYWPNREGRYHEACSVNWTEQLEENWIHNLSCRLFLISLDRQRNTHTSSHAERWLQAPNPVISAAALDHRLKASFIILRPIIRKNIIWDLIWKKKKKTTPSNRTGSHSVWNSVRSI